MSGKLSDPCKPKFVWIIRSWCSADSFWEHVREHKEYDVAYTKVETALEEINRIITKEKNDWITICSGSVTNEATRTFDIETPSPHLILSRPFIKFLSIVDKEDYMKSWYVERIQVIE